MAPSRSATSSTWPVGTNRNSASLSTNFLISQGQATRSTLTCSLVIHFIALFSFWCWCCLQRDREIAPNREALREDPALRYPAFFICIGDEDATVREENIAVIEIARRARRQVDILAQHEPAYHHVAPFLSIHLLPSSCSCFLVISGSARWRTGHIGHRR